LGGESPLFLNLENSCSASKLIFYFLLLYKASRATSDLWPILHRGPMNTLNFSSSVTAKVSGDSYSSIFRAASSEMRSVS
jgi:hypothetical protein